MSGIPSTNVNVAKCLLVGTTLVDSTAVSLLGVALPDLLILLGVDLRSASCLFFCYNIGKAFGCLAGVFLREDFDWTIGVVTALVILANTHCFIPGLSTLLAVALSYIIIGVCSGVLYVGRLVLTVVIWPSSNRGYHYTSAGVAIGNILVPIYTSVFVSRTPASIHDPEIETEELFTTNVQVSFITLSILALVIALGYTLNYRYLVGKDLELILPASDETSVSLRNTSVLYRTFILLMVCMFILISSDIVSLFSLFVTYAVMSELHLSVMTASAMMSVFSLCLLAIRMLCVSVADKLRPQVMLWMCLGLDLFVICLFAIYGDSSEAILWIIIILRGIGIGPIYSSLISFAKTYMPVTARFISIFVFLESFGNTIVPALTGLLMNNYGHDMIIYTALWIRIIQITLFAIVIGLARKLSITKEYILLTSKT